MSVTTQNKMLPSNQEAYYVEIARKINEKKIVYAELRQELDTQQRNLLDKEIKLRQTVREIIDAEIEKRFSSAETKKVIETQVAEQLAEKKKREGNMKVSDGVKKARRENPDKLLGSTDDEEKNVLMNAIAKSIKYEEKKVEKEKLKKIYIPLIREEVQKAVRKQGHGNGAASMSEQNSKYASQTRGGRFKPERDEYYRQYGRGTRGQQRSTTRRGYPVGPGYGGYEYDFPPLGKYH